MNPAPSMTPDYLKELADIADPDKLWSIGVWEQLELPPEKRRQLDAGVALRRYASHIQELTTALEQRKSLLITPLAENSTAHRLVDTPLDHAFTRRERERGMRPR